MLGAGVLASSRGSLELERCRRELALGRSELAAAESAASEQDLRQRLELAGLRKEVRALGTQLAAAYGHAAEADATSKEALRSLRGRLAEARAEMLDSERLAAAARSAEAEVVPDSLEGQAAEMAAARCEVLRPEHSELRASVEKASKRLQELADESNAMHGEEVGLEEALASREAVAAACEVRAEALRGELREVFIELRASHEETQRERKRLAEFVALRQRQQALSQAAAAAAANTVDFASSKVCRGSGDAERHMSAVRSASSGRRVSAVSSVSSASAPPAPAALGPLPDLRHSWPK